MLHEVLVEEFAHQAFGQHVLDEHFVDGGLADVGVERLATDIHELGIRPLERRIVRMGVGDAAGQAIGQGGNLLAEVGNRLLKARKRRHLVVDERLEQAGGGAGILESGAADLVAILKEHQRLGIFEQHIAKRVAAHAFVLNLVVEVVVAVFGFPIDVGQAVVVAEHAVVVDSMTAQFVAIFFDEGPLFGLAEIAEQAGKGPAQGAFGAGALGAQLGDGGGICGQRLFDVGT